MAKHRVGELYDEEAQDWDKKAEWHEEQARRCRAAAAALRGQEIDEKPRLKVKLTGRSRREQVENYLREYGPKTRGEITAETGIVAGTLANFLTLKYFDQDEMGRWKAKQR